MRGLAGCHSHLEGLQQRASDGLVGNIGQPGTQLGIGHAQPAFVDAVLGFDELTQATSTDAVVLALGRQERLAGREFAVQLLQFHAGGLNLTAAGGPFAGHGTRLGIELGAPPVREDLDLFGFVDAGRVERENPQRGEVHHDTVVSAGMGLRWQWRDQVALKLEYGHALQEASSNDAGKHKLHLNLFVRY